MSLPRLSRPAVRQRTRCERGLAGCLGSLLGAPVTVKLTRNRRRLISFHRDAHGTQTLRAHLSLAGADEHDLAIVAAWIRCEPGAGAAVRTLLANLRERWDDLAPDRDADSAGTGHHHDLNRMLREIAATYFPSLPPVLIAWTGRRGEARRRRLGSWSPRERMIRIHRTLDRADVPWYFVAHVVHHELCHAAVDPSRTPTGRARLHGPEFRALERRFAYLELALGWEREHGGMLLD